VQAKKAKQEIKKIQSGTSTGSTMTTMGGNPMSSTSGMSGSSMDGKFNMGGPGFNCSCNN